MKNHMLIVMVERLAPSAIAAGMAPEPCRNHAGTAHSLGGTIPEPARNQAGTARRPCETLGLGRGRLRRP